MPEETERKLGCTIIASRCGETVADELVSLGYTKIELNNSKMFRCEREI